MDDPIEAKISRRDLLKTGALAATAAAVPLGAAAQAPSGGANPALAPATPPVSAKTLLRVNGQVHELTLDMTSPPVFCLSG